MKMWIGATKVFPECVHFWLDRFRSAELSLIVRSDAKLLLAGTGLRLPKHGSDEVVEVELVARKVKRGRK